MTGSDRTDSTQSPSHPVTQSPSHTIPSWASVAAVALLLILTSGGAVLRLADLDNRLMHGDEANQAVKFGRLFEQGQYVYDPREHHGPSLSYLTLPVAWAASARSFAQITETHLRLVPAVFGILLVGMVWLVRDELGPTAACFAALLTAVSPAMVFYSRFYIHEMLLVGFTFGAIVALWRLRPAGSGDPRRAPPGGHFAPPRPPARSGGKSRWPSLPAAADGAWLMLLGLCVGMMHATKETCVIPLFAMAVAAVFTMGGLRRFGWKRFALRGLVVLLAAVGVSALFFSSFLDNPHGVIDSYATYSCYLGRASGQGSVGSQAFPWYHYLRILFWWRRPGGPLWTEATIAGLALVGLIGAVLGRGVSRAHLPMARFLSIYALLTTVVYSALPYKTPWCALGPLHGMVLLAGVGAAVLVRAAPGYVVKTAVVAALIAAAGHLGWQAYRASFVACDDPSNPYVYVPTTADVPLLARRVRAMAALHPDGKAMHVQVICPDGDYWPLPWYLRDFSRVGWFSRVPGGPAAPLIITQPQMKEAVLEYVYVKQPPGQPRLMQLLEKRDGVDWQLRPNVPLLVLLRLDLYEAYRAAADRP